MPKVLLIAYACQPGRGSEWGTSWAFVNELANHQPVWVLAHSDNQAELDAHLHANPHPHPIQVTYVALPRWLGWMRNSIYALHNVHYYLWQHAAGKVARKLHADVGFGVVQHISYSRWWMPSAGAALVRDGVKFIFGPNVGGEPIPKGFRKRQPLWARWCEWQRSVARSIWTRDPSLAKCIQQADIVVGGTPASVEGMAAFGPKRIEVLPCVMITDTTLIDATRPLRESRPKQDPVFRISSVGGVIHTRGVDLILRALAASGMQNYHFTHCCGGPLLDDMRKLAVELGIADRVTFTGETRHAENLEHVAKSDVLVHLALRDSQGVVPEALALGVPIIALDHHSMSPIIDDQVGHKVPMEDATPQRVIDDVARTLKTWSENRALVNEKSIHCVRRSQELSPAFRVGLFRKWHAELLAERREAVRSVSVTVAA